MKHFEVLKTSANRRIAFVRNYSESQNKKNPGFVFLGGFRSNMLGTKASFIENLCISSGYDFIKFDYSGHGDSSETFESGCISDWKNDACEVLDKLTQGPQVLVGSSMGGWISLLLGKIRPERVAAFVGIAAAPDFTEISMWESFDAKLREEINAAGRISIPSSYSEEPLIITKKLIEDGRRNLIMSNPLDIPFPVRLLQGMQDKEVHYSEAIKLAENITHDDVELTFVKGADHQFSSAACLQILKRSLMEFV
jgi:pimeloyl-ACP methyl ester carboxylesterase